METVIDTDFESIRDIVKNLAAEINNVRTMHQQIENDNPVAPVYSREDGADRVIDNAIRFRSNL